MSDTPRTDVIAHRGYRANAYIAEMTIHARSLERELDELRKNSGELVASLQTEMNNVKRELDQARQDEKQAQADICRALGERNDARAELAAERALADRLAHCLDNLQYEYLPIEAMKAFEKWKEARNGTH
jgi:uncharacterized protein (DUF3084 family)